MMTIQKAKKRAAWKNLDFSGCITIDLSFIPFSANEISSRVCALGVSLGNNPNIVTDSVNLFKDFELSRLRAKPSSTNVFSKNDLLSEEEDNEIENITLGHLCRDLMDEVMDDDNDHLSCEFRTVFKKNKSLSSTRSNRRQKVRVIKNHKQVPQWKESSGIAEALVSWLNIGIFPICQKSRSYTSSLFLKLGRKIF